MGKCNKEDTFAIQAMITVGALEKIDSTKAPTESGTVVIACGDGEHTDDWFPHLMHTCNGRRRHHLLTLNGGPALIAKHSPMATLGERDVLMEHHIGGRRLKEVTATILYAHWPCGAAGLSDVSLNEYLVLCLQAKSDMKSQLIKASEKPDVLLFMHVALPEKKRTYRVNGIKMKSYLRNSL